MFNQYDTLRDWFTEPRMRTVKRYSDLDYINEVNIYDKQTSPKTILWVWVMGILGWSLIIGISYGVYIQPHDGYWETASYYVALSLTTPFWIVAAAITCIAVKKWLNRVIGSASHCERCGKSTNFPHDFSHRTYDGITTSTTYSFCSPDCRESWERQNIEYEFSGYYDIQCEADEDKVKHENYSSAYEVDAESSLDA